MTNSIVIPEKEIEWEFVRASGPGGQNVNKVATAVQLRFDAKGSPSLPDDVRDRLMKIAGRRVTSEGVLIVNAHRFRTQERNRRDALDRFIDLIRRAAVIPRARRKTRPTLESKKRRIEGKRKRAKLKSLRKSLSPLEE